MPTPTVIACVLFLAGAILSFAFVAAAKTRDVAMMCAILGLASVRPIPKNRLPSKNLWFRPFRTEPQSRERKHNKMFFHLLKVINLLIEYLGILSSANALAGRSTPLSAGSGSQACPGGQISAFSAGSGAQACPDRRLHCPYAFCARGPCCSCQKRGEMKWPKRGQQNTEIPA